MKILTQIIVLLAALFVLSGCALIGDPIAEKVAKVVIKYCEEPFGARQTYRQSINAQLDTHGHTLHAHCAGDPAEPE